MSKSDAKELYISLARLRERFKLIDSILEKYNRQYYCQPNIYKYKKSLEMDGSGLCHSELPVSRIKFPEILIRKSIFEIFF